MSRNIKEIGKELMGKSLNSFHRKTGLTQLEENNKMQDGILDGILSQVDDAYIEKTEQSNVIHLDGSGDGVVVLDSIEGNTMVNLCPPMSEFRHGQVEVLSKTSIKIKQTSVGNVQLLKNPITDMKFKPNTLYTVYAYIKENTIDNDIQLIHSYMEVFASKNVVPIGRKQTGLIKGTFVTKDDLSNKNFCIQIPPNSDVQGYVIIENMIIVEGDKTNEEINYFEGLQSSFEEKVNGEGKYEIEILSNNKNLVSVNDFNIPIGNNIAQIDYANGLYKVNQKGNVHFRSKILNLKKNTNYTVSYDAKTTDGGTIRVRSQGVIFTSGGNSKTPFTFNTGDKKDITIEIYHNENAEISTYENIMLSKYNGGDYILQKQNKIKLLLNEPLRSVGGIKDKLYVKDGKLVVERNIGYKVISQRLGSGFRDNSNNTYLNFCKATDMLPNCKGKVLLSDKYKDNKGNWMLDEEGLALQGDDSDLNIRVLKSKIDLAEGRSYEVKFDNYIKANPYKVLYHLNVPTYEEVLNEYGEPILLEGYENGTIYIDSTIVPTTTVRYTPKMESFKTLKEVENNNIMLTNDVNDNIIPYMMDVDLMIMEKEMALMSQYKIRRIGVKDMTSMQKRTQDMLTRLIKGKTLTEQECKTRVVTYLDAGKITDAQADELMLLISEVYA